MIIRFTSTDLAGESLSSDPSVWDYCFLTVGIVAFYFSVRLLPAQRVGDGSEYYAMFLAWTDTLRPWMSKPSFDAYARFVETSQVMGMVPRDTLADLFPALHVNETSDFNHFWLYSLLASGSAALGRVAWQSQSVHDGFLLLHAGLLLLTTALSLHYLGRRGLIATLIMTFVSPVLWFVDKAHTEFFTYCLTLAAVILILRSRYIGAALCLAVASTQNLPLAAVSGFLIAVRLFLLFRQPFKAFDVVGIIATTLMVLAHPVYYLARYAVITPQLMQGGAIPGVNLRYYYIWLIDPDLGLLPNWPLGVLVLLLIGARLVRVSPDREDLRPFYGFCVVFLLVCVYAHSSTVTLNSGATPGLARYALWYMPLAYPFYLATIKWFERSSALMALGSIILTAFAVQSWSDNRPDNPEKFLEPSRVSWFIQYRFPRLYDPPAEVVIQRYGGLGAGAETGRLAGVVGPDCRKILVIPGVERNLIGGARCGFDEVKLLNVLRIQRTSIAFPSYVHLSDTIAESLHAVFDSNRVLGVGVDQEGGVLLGTGWSGREAWGVWSDGPAAQILLPCPADLRVGGKILSVRLRLAGFSFSSHLGTNLTIRSGSHVFLNSFVGASSKEVVFDFPASLCTGSTGVLDLDIADPASPSELGPSIDRRRLGVALLTIQYTIVP